MKISDNSSIKTLLVQKQSQPSNIFGNTFSALMDENNSSIEKDIEETTSPDSLINHQQDLQNKAYLNKLSLGIAV
jgi:hypothetical protein